MKNKDDDIKDLITLAQQALPAKSKSSPDALKSPTKKNKRKPSQATQQLVEKATRAKYSTIEDFIEAMGITEGRKRVMSRALFDLYKTWSLNPVDKVTFYHEFSKYFHSQRIESANNYHVYLLNIPAWEIQLKVKENGEKEK